jgi:hypothetical protein
VGDIAARPITAAAVFRQIRQKWVENVRIDARHTFPIVAPMLSYIAAGPDHEGAQQMRYYIVCKTGRCAGIALLALMGFACIPQPSEPVAPTWDVNVTVPVFKRSYTIQDILGGATQAKVPVTNAAVCDTAQIGDTVGTGSGNKRIDPETMNSVNFGRVHVEIVNGFPMHITMKTGLLDRWGRFLLALPKSDGDSLRVEAATVLGGGVEEPVVSSSIIELVGADLDKFNPAEMVRYFITLSTPTGQPVTVDNGDTLHVRMWAEFSYQVNQ